MQGVELRLEPGRLTVLMGPNGSGKTTLALEWIASQSCHTAWLSLDLDDNDPMRFIRGFIAALQLTGETLNIPAGQRGLKTIMADLINQLGETDPIALVLDDYHLIQTPAIHKALLFLLDHLPPQLHIILSARADPPWPLARLRGQGIPLEQALNTLAKIYEHQTDQDGASPFTPEDVVTKVVRAYDLYDPNPDPEITEAQEGFVRRVAAAAPASDPDYAMDQAGNLAIGYSVSSSTLFPSIRYAGRLATDPPAGLFQGETTLQAGAGSQTDSSSRWGDYSMLAVDPTDDCTFWYTTEYYTATSARSWTTRIGSFRFATCTAPVASADLSLTKSGAPDPVTVGDTVTYTVVVTNGGPDAATGVTVTDTLPAEVTFVSATATQGTCSGTTTVSCALGTLANGASVWNASWWSCENSSGAYIATARTFDILARDADPGTEGPEPFTFVHAAGNFGSPGPSIGSPGGAKNLITVGATNNARAGNHNSMAGFSSRGPNDDWMLKPDIVAPGNNITAPAPRAGQLASVDGYADAGGTSMSAPHISGVAALLSEAHPDWTPQMTKTAMMNTAVQLRNPDTGDLYSVLDQGAGLVDAHAAVNTPALIGETYKGHDVYPDGDLARGSVSFGQVTVDGRTTVTKPLTLVNVSDSEARWRLTWEPADAHERHGEGRDAGVRGFDVQLERRSIRVAAGEAAGTTVTLTLDERLEAGDYEGRIVATDGATQEQYVVLALLRGERILERRRARVRRDSLDLLLAELVRHEGADRRLEGAGGDGRLTEGVAACVQDLHGDPAAVAVHGLGDHPVLGDLFVIGELGAAGEGGALGVGGDPAGDDEADPAAGAFGVEGGHPLETAGGLLQADVHGAHDHAVPEGGEAQVQGFQKVGVLAHEVSSRGVPLGRCPADPSSLCNKLHNESRGGREVPVAVRALPTVAVWRCGRSGPGALSVDRG